METSTKLAIAALIISVMGVLINSVLNAMTFRKSARLEFLQRRDQLSQKISDLNSRNNEAQLISAKYALVAVKNTGLPLRGEHADQNAALIESIKKQREGIEEGIKLWEANIDSLHFIYRNLTLETDAHKVEELIAIVQVASDNRKKFNDRYSSNLHILETTNEFLKTTLAERDEKIRQINLDFDRETERINLDFDRETERINRNFERAIEQLTKSDSQAIPPGHK